MLRDSKDQGTKGREGERARGEFHVIGARGDGSILEN